MNASTHYRRKEGRCVEFYFAGDDEPAVLDSVMLGDLSQSEDLVLPNAHSPRLLPQILKAEDGDGRGTGQEMMFVWGREVLKFKSEEVFAFMKPGAY